MRSDIKYTGNNQETYSLKLNNNVVAEILTGEDGAIAITEDIKNFVKDLKQCSLVIQNDEDKLGVIVDAYVEDDHVDGRTFWFEDYID